MTVEHKGLELGLATVDSNVDAILVDTGTTLDGYLDIIGDHAHSVQKVAPDLASGIEVTCGSGAWTLGGAATITGVPGAGTWDIHFVNIYDIDTAGAYQLELYDDTVAVCKISFSKKSVTADDYCRVPVTTPIMAGGSTITAKLASLAGAGTEKCKVKVQYHTY